MWPHALRWILSNDNGLAAVFAVRMVVPPARGQLVRSPMRLVCHCSGLPSFFMWLNQLVVLRRGKRAPFRADLSARSAKRRQDDGGHGENDQPRRKSLQLSLLSPRPEMWGS